MSVLPKAVSLNLKFYSPDEPSVYNMQFLSTLFETPLNFWFSPLYIIQIDNKVLCDI